MRPTAMLVTVPAANHSDAGRQRRPRPPRSSMSTSNAETPALSTATVQKPIAAPSTGNRAP